MAVAEESRYEMHQRLNEVPGRIDRLAERMDGRFDSMSAMIARRDERLDGRIDQLAIELRHADVGLGRRIDHQGALLKRDIQALDKKIDGLSDRVGLKIDSLGNELRTEFRDHVRTLLIGITAALTAVGSLVLTGVRLL